MIDRKAFIAAVMRERCQGDGELHAWSVIIERLTADQAAQLETFLRDELDRSSQWEEWQLAAYVAEERLRRGALKEMIADWSRSDAEMAKAAQDLPEMRSGSFLESDIDRMFATEESAAGFLASLSVVQLQDMIDFLAAKASDETTAESTYLIELLGKMQQETFRDMKNMKSLLSPFGQEMGGAFAMYSNIEKLEQLTLKLSA